jgi:hypothetical protein
VGVCPLLRVAGVVLRSQSGHEVHHACPHLEGIGWAALGLAAGHSNN